MKIIFSSFRLFFRMFFAAFGLAVFFSTFWHVAWTLLVCVSVCIALDHQSLGNFSPKIHHQSVSRRWKQAKAFQCARSCFAFLPPSDTEKDAAPTNTDKCAHEGENMNLNERKCALNDKLSENALFFRPREISCACDGLLINSTRENGEIESPFAVAAFYSTRPIFDFHRSNDFSAFLVYKDSRWGIFPIAWSFLGLTWSRQRWAKSYRCRAGHLPHFFPFLVF